MRFALCLDLAPYCKGGFLMNAVLASISQTQGTWQNAFMDPVDTELLAAQHPELMRETLKVYCGLVQASHTPTSLHSCAAANHLFVTGRCAMTIDWGYAFMYMYNVPPILQTFQVTGNRTQRAAPHSSAIELVGNLGVSPLPGSSRVYDRGERIVKECSQSTCPLATQDIIVTYSTNASSVFAGPSKASNSSSSSGSNSSSGISGSSGSSGTNGSGRGSNSSGNSSSGSSGRGSSSSSSISSSSVSSSSGGNGSGRRHHRCHGGNGSEGRGSTGSSSSFDQRSSMAESREDLGGQREQNSAPVAEDKQLVVDGRRTAWVNRAPYSVFIAGITTLCNPTIDETGRETRVYQTQRMSATSQTVSSIVLPPAVFEAAKRAMLKSKLDELGEDAAVRAHTLVTKDDFRGKGGPPLLGLGVPDFSDGEMASWWLQFDGKPEDELAMANEQLFFSAADSRRYFQALWKARYTYRNQAPDFTATPLVSRAHRLVMEEVALYAAAAPSFSMDIAVGGVKNRSIDAMQADPSSKQAMQAALWRATAFDESMLEAPASGLTPGQLGGSIAGPVAFVLLVALVALPFGLHSSRKKRHRTLWGASIPPKISRAAHRCGRPCLSACVMK
ncbi:hypothetical protein DUNSADRAFT_18051 [Dunaliella salina]|uniref:Uncharacterized protein n=1 Tax=Dunaliella salina TaxID=3046 RepID=A0ABQ7GZN1_DUNSA|nr:hypothetical protein DUNSADRAFT_18051 [Dunaliella salina]|eukprot:KAF5840017.1 hypothetical protein DUNSADRAFT_18051 [Dunaliella salina]